MTIECANMSIFGQVIAELVQHGLTFTANAERGIIVLTGGY